MKITHNQVVENTQFTLETEEGKTDYFVIRVGVADIRGKVSQKPTPEWCYMAWLLKRAHTPDHTDAWSTTIMPIEAHWILGKSGKVSPQYEQAPPEDVDLGNEAWAALVKTMPENPTARPVWNLRLLFTLEVDKKFNTKAIPMTDRPAARVKRTRSSAPLQAASPAPAASSEEDDEPMPTPRLFGDNGPRLLSGPKARGGSKRKQRDAAREEQEVAGDPATVCPDTHTMYHTIANAAGRNNIATMMSINAMTLQSEAIHRREWQLETDAALEKQKAENAATAAVTAAHLKTIEERAEKERAVMFAALIPNRSAEPQRPQPASNTEPVGPTMEGIAGPMKMLLSDNEKVRELGATLLKRVFKSEEDTTIDMLREAIACKAVSAEDVRSALKVFFELLPVCDCME